MCRKCDRIRNVIFRGEALISDWQEYPDFSRDVFNYINDSLDELETIVKSDTFTDELEDGD